jgi:hypothetical protein
MLMILVGTPTQDDVCICALPLPNSKQQVFPAQSKQAQKSLDLTIPLRNLNKRFIKNQIF